MSHSRRNCGDDRRDDGRYDRGRDDHRCRAPLPFYEARRGEAPSRRDDRYNRFHRSAPPQERRRERSPRRDGEDRYHWSAPPRDERRRERSLRRDGDDRGSRESRPTSSEHLRRYEQQPPPGGPPRSAAEPWRGPRDEHDRRPRGQALPTQYCPPSSGSIDPRLLTARLKKSSGVDELLRLAEAHGDDFNPIHCSAAWSYLGKQAYQCRQPYRHEPLGRLLRLTAARVPAAGARELANVAHGVAKSHVAKSHALGARGLFDAVAAAAPPKLSEFEPQHLANTAWAFATAGHEAPALLDAIAAAAVSHMSGFTPQGLANTAWAYATLGHPAPALLDAIAEEARKRPGEFSAQDRDRMSWAYAAARHEVPAWLDKIFHRE